MAQNKVVRLNSRALAHDTATYQAWQSIPNYQSNNSQFVTDAVTASRVDLEAAQAAEAQAKGAYDAACAHTGKTEFNFHNVMLGVKDQVASQFGRDSNEYQALGLKKKSERKSPTRKKA